MVRPSRLSARPGKSLVQERLDDASTMQTMQQELERLRLFEAELLSPIDMASSFNMLDPDDAEQLARQIWLGGYAESLAAVRAANPALVRVIEAKVTNTYDRRSSDGHRHMKCRLVDGILLCTIRAQSKFNMPLVSAGLSILSLANCVPAEFHEAVRRFANGLLTTETWVEDFLVKASRMRPPPHDTPLKDTAVAVFDNLSMKLNYGSYMVEGASGERKDMTNWFYVIPPAKIAPETFDADRIFREGIFRKGVSITRFCRLFYLDSPEVKANRSGRWTKYMRAIQNGKHMARPMVKPTWCPHKIYKEPVWDRLQSSYDDVRFEMNKMRAAFPNLKILFIAGDGLSLMRMNHLLKHEHDFYLDSSPATIPVQGEAPHGLFHGMHCQWRLFRPFIMKCAEILDNEQVKSDPTVSDLNVSRFFLLNILTPAVGEYILELCSSDPAADDWDDPDPFMAKASKNVDFAWLCHFLHDNAFWCLDFLQSVRGNDSHNLDVLWRELFSSAHTDTAHKTQYVGMSIMRVFWGSAMCADLDALYHAMRTIPSGTHDGCGVGWDWSIELLNHAIKSHVDMHVSEVQITKFVESWACVEHVQSQLREIIYANRAEKHWRGRDVTADITKLKEFFRSTVGSTWAQATRDNTTVHVTTGPSRQMKPWTEISRKMAASGDAAPHAYIRAYVTGMTPYFEWSP